MFASSSLTVHRSEPPFDAAAVLPGHRELGRAEVLYHAGDEAERVFRVDEGLLKLSLDLPSGKERIVSIAGPGDFVGAVTATHTYQETVSALSPRVRLSVGDAQDADGSLNRALRHAALAQLAQARDGLLESDLSVSVRLAHTFLRLGERFGSSVQDGSVHLTLPLTHDDLAALVGAARETTTTTLSDLRARGLLSGTRGHYRLQPERLRAFALEQA